MSAFRPPPSAPVITATVCAGAVSAQFIAGKATRDALYLAQLDVTSLPMIIAASAAFSLILVALSARALRHLSPAVVIPATFTLNAILLMVAWGLTDSMPRVAAQGVYLLITGLGPMLGSGFWLIATGRFDPHSARKHFGQIAGIGTLSGLGGALVAERVAATLGITAMLPVLAALNVVCAFEIYWLARTNDNSLCRPSLDGAPDLAPASPQSGLRVLGREPYLRNLAALVLLGTIGAALADYAFKAEAVKVLGRGDALLRFFAIFYAGTSLLAFVVQATSSSFALQRLGLATTTGTPSIALLVGGAGALLFPGLAGVVTARGAESVFRGSLFRTGYEIFYTPIPVADKNAAKSFIDVGVDRIGEAMAGGLIRLLILLPTAGQYGVMMVGAMGCAAAALAVGRRLNQGYINTLERSLINRAVELDLADAGDLTTRTVMLRTLRSPSLVGDTRTRFTEAPSVTTTLPLATVDQEIQEILALRSRNRDSVLNVLRGEEGLPAPLIPHVIPLLGWDPVSEDAITALRKVAEDHVGQLTDTMIDPNQDFAIRRRVARVFSVCVSQRAVDGTLLGLDDTRFEVRFQCGRSLAAILERNSRIRIDAERIFDVVRREVAVGRPVWESHRLLDRPDDHQRGFVDQFLKDRAGQSLAHVFTLLSLVLPTTPLQIAYRGLHTDDPALRGTALEYLEGVLPSDIRDRLWPFLTDQPRRGAQPKPREEILADLLRSNDSIMLNIEELRHRRTRSPRAAGEEKKS